MADASRSRILLALLDGPGYPAGLARDLDLTRSNVSNHLACLRGCGLVVAAPEGRQTRYEIADPHLTAGIRTLMEAVVAVSLAVMPLLSWAERRAGRELGSASAVADSKQTLLCAYLSAAVLLGLLANAALGWAWADSVAALVIAVFAVREGVEAWRGDACTTPVGMLTGEIAEHHDD